MHEEQIRQIMEKVAIFGLTDKGAFAAQPAVDAYADIRQSIERLVANPSVTQEWVMIEDGETYMVINTGIDGRVYCRGMHERDAWDLVRRLNGIEE